MNCLPHWNYYNLPHDPSKQTNLSNPEEDLAERIVSDIKYNIVDGFHRQGVSIKFSNLFTVGLLKETLMPRL
jgi:hypothetical protein